MVRNKMKRRSYGDVYHDFEVPSSETMILYNIEYGCSCLFNPQAWPELYRPLLTFSL